jgi:hypothetical protein
MLLQENFGLDPIGLWEDFCPDADLDADLYTTIIATRVELADVFFVGKDPDRRRNSSYNGIGAARRHTSTGTKRIDNWRDGARSPGTGKGNKVDPHVEADRYGATMDEYQADFEAKDDQAKRLLGTDWTGREAERDKILAELEKKDNHRRGSRLTPAEVELKDQLEMHKSAGRVRDHRNQSDSNDSIRSSSIGTSDLQPKTIVTNIPPEVTGDALKDELAQLIQASKNDYMYDPERADRITELRDQINKNG